MKKVVLLFSPGLDSYLANHILSKKKDIELSRVYFDCCKYSFNEIEFLNSRYDVGNSIFSEVKINNTLKLHYIERADSYIPNRNLMFVTMAATFGNVDEIYINSMKDDRCIDSNKDIYTEYSKVLSKSMGRNIEIKSLFWEKEKANAVYDYLSEGGSKFDLLINTYSCFSSEYHKSNTPIYSYLDTITGKKYKYIGSFQISGCLKCPACFRKICALTAANIYVPFKNKNLVNEYRNLDKDQYPYRYKTIKDYLDFLNA